MTDRNAAALPASSGAVLAQVPAHPCDRRRRCVDGCYCPCGPCIASRRFDRGIARLFEKRAHPLPCTDPTCTWHNATKEPTP